MNKKYWIEEDGEYILCYVPFHEEIKLASLSLDEDDNKFYKVSHLYEKEYEERYPDTTFVLAGNLESAKEEVEDMILIYFEDKSEYYEHLAKVFSGDDV